MTLAHEYEQPPFPPHAPSQTQPPAPKPKFNWKTALIVFAAVLIGGVIGSVSNPAPPPEVQVQVQEKTVEKEVTPEACLNALDLNEEAFGYLTDSLGHILKEDYVAANRATEKAKALSPAVTIAKTECRSK